MPEINVANVHDEQRWAILRTARAAITECVTGTRSEAEACPTVPDVGATGVFVTIHVDGQLRGCIGFVDNNAPFDVSLAEAAKRAASEDPRFAAIQPDELHRMSVDVTLLGPLEDIHDSSDIERGTHGLRIDMSGKRGLLLPQVAVEQGWTNEEFLAGVCRKAFLPLNAWKHPSARLSRFIGIVLREHTAGDETSQQTTRTT